MAPFSPGGVTTCQEDDRELNGQHEQHGHGARSAGAAAAGAAAAGAAAAGAAAAGAAAAGAATAGAAAAGAAAARAAKRFAHLYVWLCCMVGRPLHVCFGLVWFFFFFSLAYIFVVF